MSSSQDVIVLDGVSKRFSSVFSTAVNALSNVSLTVKRGESFGFIGENGAGKSTTIKILLGALRRDSGTAVINGKDVQHFRARIGVGYVPESPYLPDQLTAFEIVMFAGLAQGLRRQEAKSAAHRVLERVGMSEAARRKVRGFSKGMGQRTALAQALVSRPAVLILDEPLSGLDPLGRIELMDVLANYVKDGGTLFFSSHVLSDVERLADRVAIIHKGQIKAIADPRDLMFHEGLRFVVRYYAERPLDGSAHLREGLYAVVAGQDDLRKTLDEIAGIGGRLAEVRPDVTLERYYAERVTE